MQLFQATAVLLCGALISAAPLPRSSQPVLDRRQQSKRATGYRTSSAPLTTNSIDCGRPMIINQSDKVQYSSNWAGAIQVSHNVTQVEATITIPSVTTPPNADPSSAYGGSAWIGIDGESCPGTIVKTGVDWVLQGNTTTYSAWYEFQPEGKVYDFDLQILPGDQVSFEVEMDGEDGAMAYITNDSTGQTISHSFGGELSDCQANAEWIIEDFSTISESGKKEMIPFALFGEIKLQGASFTHDDGVVGGMDGATILAIQQGGKTLTSCSVVGEDGMECGYTGDAGRTADAGVVDDIRF